VTTFALLHGAWGDGWCWRLVAEELGRRGHRAVAVDLPAGEPDMGGAACADLAVEALDGVDDDITVVGHSMGGLVAPIVAERRPVRRVVFVAGLLPLVGSSFYEQSAAAGRGQIVLPGLGRGQVDHGDGSSSWVDLDQAIAKMCPDAPRAVAVESAGRLRRQYWTVMSEVSPLIGWPDVEYASVVCTDDAVVNPVWGRQSFRDRFHVQARELPGEHSPHLARPTALVDLLTAPP
jgi:pimeloyl-ACP methyl ester carboxylesterase